VTPPKSAGADRVTKENSRHVQARELKAVRTLQVTAIARHGDGEISWGTFVRLMGQYANRLSELADAIEPKGGA
jgi:hypothetical protein